ncbi:hypothetical protein BFP70_07240 [Thioclava sp. SK-1]|uniref:hypothetical protein n=1 Tax=Thioclava sp. SK-1 TaxID=1889770 RepID=UPI000826D6E1|nr:hypothetical protein [Thioclava sp. SK-1]OCX65915.1 hypothetical protein BFP70_07240 [Thioclava sp. SK-1]
MAITKDHELHKRRLTRNLGLGGALIAFCVIVFGLTIVKVKNGSMMQGFDHEPRVSMTPAVEPVK